MSHTPGPTEYTCRKCGWVGTVNGRPRCLPCAREAVKQWRRNHHDKYLAQKRRYEHRLRKERRPEYRARKRRRYDSRTAALRWQTRREWLLCGNVTREQLQRLYQSSGGICYYCLAIVPNPRFSPSDPRGFDHVCSRAKGGMHTISNMVVCCRKCNERKG